MSAAVTLLTADWLLDSTAAPLPGGAVGVEGERIVAVGTTERVLDELRARGLAADRVETLHLVGCALLPGLVNAHTHLDLTLLRGLFEDSDFFSWIRRLTRAKAEVLEDGHFRLGAELGALELIRSGVTCVGDTSDQDVVSDVLQGAGLRGMVFREVFGPGDFQCDNSIRGLRSALARLGPKTSSRVRLGVSPHAPYSVSPRLFREVTDLALSEGLPMAIHAAESRHEASLVRDGIGPFADLLRGRGIALPPRAPSIIAYLERQGVLRARPLIIHAVQVDAADIELLRASGASVAHCPRSNAKLGHGVAPLDALLSAGVPTGVGTDGAVSSNACDLLEEARYAVLAARARGGLPGTALDARGVLRLLTLGGAEALGIADRVGSLEPGKDADITAVDLTGLHHVPVHDPEASIVFSARAQDVALTMVAGRVLYRRGEFTTLDASEIEHRVRRAAPAFRAAIERLGAGP